MYEDINCCCCKQKLFEKKRSTIRIKRGRTKIYEIDVDDEIKGLTENYKKIKVGNIYLLDILLGKEPRVKIQCHRKECRKYFLINLHDGHMKEISRDFLPN